VATLTEALINAGLSSAQANVIAARFSDSPPSTQAFQEALILAGVDAEAAVLLAANIGAVLPEGAVGAASYDAQGRLLNPSGGAALDVPTSNSRNKGEFWLTDPEFGIVGDGVADDYDGIVKWQNAMRAAGKAVRGVVPDGVYRHTRPLVWSNLRNVTISGGGGNLIQPSALFVFDGDPVLYADGGVKFLSVLNVDINGIGFKNATNGINYHLVISANNSPSLSSHTVLLTNCGLSASSGVSCVEAGILVANAKNVVITGGLFDARSQRVIRFGLDSSESPSTLMQGAASMCKIENAVLFGDVDRRHVSGLEVSGCGFDDLSGVADCSSMTVSGQERVSGEQILGNVFTQDVNTATRPAIDTGSFAGTASLASASGVSIVGNTFRDRAIGVNIARGGVHVGPNVWQLRNTRLSGCVGINIEAGVSGSASIQIDPSNDFSLADTNNLVPIVDNRSALSDQVVFSSELATDTAFSSAGSYVTFITGNTARPLRGGKYRITYHADILTTSNSGGFFRAEAVVNGVTVPSRSRVSISNSSQGCLHATRIFKLDGTTNPVTVSFRLQQETTGAGLSTVRSAGTLGSTYIEIEELA
jgi:hypothetical protein